ncbi:metallophosphoesterase family protein [Streptomyces hesseae]|uniref:Metallophosphoesterase n=1 Tax=Streptomyces hesseae TaxID=3075519 RepID=A0ABU2SVS9_9ACTN|nr:metallophosphoesterase [Streptomyces sp. DSM 40473]MDT0453107.1 metallophosphoesterase [Streptomyces sp. DSM 40473]
MAAGMVKGSGGHMFARKRPSAGLHMEPPRDTHFRPLPPPTGAAPFRLDLKDVLDARTYDAIAKAGSLTFHMNGDMGGIDYAVPQELVAAGMEDDLAVGTGPAGKPAFLYVVGDCVYFNGEIAKYYAQFYQPYEFYGAPIFAVPGNHDGENLPGGSTLDGFVRNFCAPEPVKMPEAQDSHRKAMVQPNVYWTLLTPCVNFIGLYSNVPAGGEIQPDQAEWLAGELKALPVSVPIILTLHHPPYSADDHHSGSTYMKTVIEDAAAAAGRHPDMIVAGHVHDYQRLTKTTTDGTQYLYLVTGAGGYHNLHAIRKVDGEKMIPPVTFADTAGDPVTLDSYCDDQHGFLRLSVDQQKFTGRYYRVPRPQDPRSKGSQLFDYFEYDWVNHKLLPNQQ